MVFFFNFFFSEENLKPLKGNKGEGAEVYIFLKLLVDGKVYAADKNMQKIAERYLKILRIFREEIQGHKFEYIPGTLIEVVHNGTRLSGNLSSADVCQFKDKIWTLLAGGQKGIIFDSEIQRFLNQMYVTKLKSPAVDNGFFGGTKDIVMEVQDYNTGLDSVVGFSCKSDFSGPASLFNASKDNTNFQFVVKGAMTDSIADEFNSLFDDRGNKKVVATARRIRFLKNHNCKLIFDKVVSDVADRNLIMACGAETPLIVAEMLRHYYYDGEGAYAYSSMSKLVQWLATSNVASYSGNDVESMYRYKVSRLLYAMFTGMRLGSMWSGRSSVNGGYIIVRGDGDVLAYHTCIADEFMDFLVQRLALEQPSHGRHHSMNITKDLNGEYLLKLPLQVRFKGMKSDE